MFQTRLCPLIKTFYLISILTVTDTQLSHISAKDQCMYYDSNQCISSFGSTTETISMVHVNIRSARKNITDFFMQFEVFEMKI